MENWDSQDWTEYNVLKCAVKKENERKTMNMSLLCDWQVYINWETANSSAYETSSTGLGRVDWASLHHEKGMGQVF